MRSKRPFKNLLLLVAALLPWCAMAQVEETDSWHFGVSAGMHTSFMSISKLNQTVYPQTADPTAPVFSIFAQKAWGEEFNFAIRPELAFTSRGGILNKIMSLDPGYYQQEGLTNLKYQAKGNYVDLRLPLMYRLGARDWRFRPYVYVAPILGFTTGGYVQKSMYLANGGRQTEKVKASSANMAKTYFSGAIGIGTDYRFYAGDNLCAVGLELMYEHGFTNTYGHDSEATTLIPMVPGLGDEMFTQNSSRKYSGLEIKLTLSVPLSIFSKKKPQPVPVVEPPLPEPVKETPAPESEPEPEPVVVQPVEKHCYSLEEINDMMARGESVYGKTICAIDDAITFEFDKSEINPRSYAYLDLLAQTLIRTNARIMVKGHTDNIGTEAYNLKLSKERAISVVKYLESRGVPKSKLLYSYYGMSLPLESNDTEEGRSMNRRVEFEILNDK